ncbi:hypothetical protein C8N24_0653 [Solirubrobacter pauli]|uniref:Uncharacterized protein n=1 Tax=Solirubrobacter pauli TaxID=166793 RepID=A0A660L705_9ACTN|nr:hypothetical protein C8N24_0653 [Solirubrobacter pauli]
MCQRTSGLVPAHLARHDVRCEHPDCVVPMCVMHQRAFEAGHLDLLRYLEPRWRQEIAHTVMHVGLITAYRRLTAGRFPSVAPSRD